MRQVSRQLTRTENRVEAATSEPLSARDGSGSRTPLLFLAHPRTYRPTSLFP
jgi:hypothetical protein